MDKFSFYVLAQGLLSAFIMIPVKIKNVYIVTDFGSEIKISESKIGVAFVCADDSLNVKLDAIPLTGMLHITDQKYKPKDRLKK